MEPKANLGVEWNLGWTRVFTEESEECEKVRREIRAGEKEGVVEANNQISSEEKKKLIEGNKLPPVEWGSESGD